MVEQNWERHIYLYFYASFINAGLQNVIPQVFFSEHYPQQEALLLSICLLAGAAASISTIWLTGTYRSTPAVIRKRTVWVQLLSIVSLLILLWVWQTALVYIITFMLLRACVQALFNRLDHHYVAQTPPQQMVSFARKSTFFRLLGIMAGPFYFALLYPYASFNIGVLLVLSALFVWSLSSVLRGSRGQVTVARAKTVGSVRKKFILKNEHGSRQSTYFVIYMFMTTTGIYVFSSNVLMIVRDLYSVPAAVAKTGTLLLLMNATGLIAVALWPMLLKKVDKLFPRRPRSRGQALYAILFLCCVILLKWPLVTSYTYLLVLSMFTGAVYGLFWMRTREFAIDQQGGAQKQWMLTLYNNANNFAILLAALVLLSGAALSSIWNVAYLNVITSALIVCFAAATVYALRFDVAVRKYKKECVVDVPS